MDPERTGRDNLMHMGLYHLILPRQMEKFVDSIIEFAELGDFIDLPVRTYSDGMRARLLFAISTAVRGDILVMDEWLSAGDADFVEKAQERLKDLLNETKIVVLSSHSLEIIRKMCNVVCWMEGGRVVMVGDADVVLPAYLKGVQRPVLAPSVEASA